MTAGPVLIGLKGLTLNADERELLLHPQVGGVVLFARNYENPEQLAALIADIHHLRQTLLVSVDHEGGRVQRFDQGGFTVLPPPSCLGLLYDHDAQAGRTLAERYGWLMAVELRSVGIDINFAPVIDLASAQSDVLAGRTLHAQAEVVSLLAMASLRGMHQGGLAAVAKHFPGHGGVSGDSHHELPIDERSLLDIEAADLLPFARLASNGLEAVMAAHVLYRQVDCRPAGYSPFWLQTVLRQRLNFQGAIFSDDLQMQAAAWAGDIGDRVEAALAAGCDAVLVCQNQAEVGTLLESMEKRVDPVSRLRLARLRPPRQGKPWKTLRHDPLWQQARQSLARLEQEVNPQLPL